MMNLRNTNSRCFTCGSQIPSDVEVATIDDYAEFVCPDCGSRIAECIISTDGQPADSVKQPPGRARRFTVDPTTNWRRWEVWWTNYGFGVYIHGTCVNDSPPGFDKFVDSLEDYL